MYFLFRKWYIPEEIEIIIKYSMGLSNLKIVKRETHTLIYITDKKILKV